jgi:hypothetical protein
MIPTSTYVSKKSGLGGLALILFAACSVFSGEQTIRTGPEVGSTVPSFEAPDQNSQVQNLKSIAGPQGALLVFYASADY